MAELTRFEIRLTQSPRSVVLAEIDLSKAILTVADLSNANLTARI